MDEAVDQVMARSSDEKGADKALAKYYEQLTGQHGTKDAYVVEMLTLFNEGQHMQTSNETMISSDEPQTEIDF